MLHKLKMLFAALLLALVPCEALAEDTYSIEVDITNQIVTVYYANDISPTGIVRQMICSTGMATSEDDTTPTGEYKLNQRYDNERSEWYEIPKYDCFVQYATRIVGPILFHSLPYHEADLETLDLEAAAQLGDPASHGCIRLLPEDAKWIALNCPNGTDCRIFHSNDPNEFLRERLLNESFTIDGPWFTYSDYIAGAGGLVAAVEALLVAPADAA